MTRHTITIGVLALQGAFYEHVKLLRKAVTHPSLSLSLSSASPASPASSASSASPTSSSEPSKEEREGEGEGKMGETGERGGGWEIIEVRNQHELDRCDALVIPGGESTSVSLVAERGGLLDGLRGFVKFVPPFSPFPSPTSSSFLSSAVADVRCVVCWL